jgi:hypothetical protein
MGSFKILFSRTTKPEKLMFTKKKLPDVVQIQVCTIMIPGGRMGPKWEK